MPVQPKSEAYSDAFSTDVGECVAFSLENTGTSHCAVGINDENDGSLGLPPNTVREFSAVTGHLYQGRLFGRFTGGLDDDGNALVNRVVIIKNVLICN